MPTPPLLPVQNRLHLANSCRTHTHAHTRSPTFTCTHTDTHRHTCMLVVCLPVHKNSRAILILCTLVSCAFILFCFLLLHILVIFIFALLVLFALLFAVVVVAVACLPAFCFIYFDWLTRSFAWSPPPTSFPHRSPVICALVHQRALSRSRPYLCWQTAAHSSVSRSVVLSLRLSASLLRVSVCLSVRLHVCHCL